jgi:hypothetical protein
MDDAASYWNTLQSALDTAWTDLQHYTAYILADAQGAAADAFNDYVDGLTATGHGSLTRAIQMTQDLHDVCILQADEVRRLRRTLEQFAIEFVATLAIGQFVSMLTFGTAEEVTAAVETGLTTRLTAWAAEMAADGTRLAEVLNSTAVALSKVMVAAFTGGTQSAMIAEADLGATDVIGLAFGEKPASGAAPLKTALEGGAVGAVLGQGSAGGLLGLGTAAASERLIDLGEAIEKSDEGSVAGPAFMTLGRQLKSGSIGRRRGKRHRHAADHGTPHHSRHGVHWHCVEPFSHHDQPAHRQARGRLAAAGPCRSRSAVDLRNLQPRPGHFRQELSSSVLGDGQLRHKPDGQLPVRRNRNHAVTQQSGTRRQAQEHVRHHAAAENRTPQADHVDLCPGNHRTPPGSQVMNPG